MFRRRLALSRVAEDDASMRAWAEELVARARTEGVELTGDNGLRSERGRHVGQGLLEFRVRHTAWEMEAMFGDAPLGGKSEKVLLRVFCHAYRDKIILLLDGYDKGEDPSEKRQRTEISVARKRLVEFNQRQALERKTQRRKGGGDRRKRA